MTTKGKYGLRILALATMGMALAASAAETPVSVVSATCPGIPASRTLSVVTSQAVTAGQSIVLAVAINSADAPDLVVTGPAGVAWSTLGGNKSELRDRSVLLLRGRASQNLASGAAIQLAFGLVESSRNACVLGLRFSSFIDGGAATATDGQALGVAADAPTVSGKNSVQTAMGIAAFVFDANTGVMSTSPGAISDGGACNAALDLCLRVAHQGDVSGAVNIDNTPTTASDWIATLAVLNTPGLFKDGFE